MNERGQIKRTWSETIGDGKEALFGWFGSFMPQKKTCKGFDLPEVGLKKVIAVTEAVRRYERKLAEADEVATGVNLLDRQQRRGKLMLWPELTVEVDYSKGKTLGYSSVVYM